MRVLNSGRRWGNDVPTSLDLSRDIDVLGVQVGDRSLKQLQIGRRLAALEAQLKQVTFRFKRQTCMRNSFRPDLQVETRLDAILAVAQNLLLKMESSHPLVPKRKLTASQMQRGKIYKRPDSTPQSVAAELLRHSQHVEADSSPQRHHPQVEQASHTFAAAEIRRKKPEMNAAIRIDPKLASIFELEPSGGATPGKGTTLN
jgi:hypothetical protein